MQHKASCAVDSQQCVPSTCSKFWEAEPNQSPETYHKGGLFPQCYSLHDPRTCVCIEFDHFVEKKDPLMCQ